MRLSCIAALLAFAVAACAEGTACEKLTRAEALRTAREAKDGMLERSLKDYAANFPSDEPVFVKIGNETAGFAANVGFKGRDGTTLIALIYGDCYVGWTER